MHTCEKAFKMKENICRLYSCLWKAGANIWATRWENITDNLPESFIMKLTMNHNYWRGRNDEDA